MDMAICGTKIEPNHQTSEDGELGEEDGQNCVVCISMECPTCPEDEEDTQIVGRPASGL